jgi:orotate phosphoribosyltransferase
MSAEAQAFIEFALAQGVLRFGAFTLKSGRQSPYFFDSGLFNTGASLAALGKFYARAIRASAMGFDMLFAPAYKGIPLVAAVAIAFAEHHGLDVPYAFNRKEAKDHGEGGLIVGTVPRGRVVIVDDVITAGTSVRESVDLIRQSGALPAGVVVALDRRESGPFGRSAVQEVECTYGVPVVPIATLDDLIMAMDRDPSRGAVADTLRAHRARHGIQA